MKEKKALRKKIRKLRDQRSVGFLREASSLVKASLEAYLVELNPQVLGVYAPLRDEVDWTLGEATEWRYQLAFPDFRQGAMRYFICRTDQLKLSKNFDVEIPTPPQGAPEVFPDAVLVPGLAFTKSGARLGRGKGFFDRYLTNYKGTRIGLCFEEDLLPEIPQDTHDQNVHVVVTQRGVYK
jgi:5-formyltetrahydrofolate cyclo-ligase